MLGLNPSSADVGKDFLGASNRRELWPFPSLDIVAIIVCDDGGRGQLSLIVFSFMFRCAHDSTESKCSFESAFECSISVEAAEQPDSGVAPETASVTVMAASVMTKAASVTAASVTTITASETNAASETAAAQMFFL